MSMDAHPFGMPRPDHVTTAAEFFAAMRALRSWTKLTYRQLEIRAMATGDWLPRTTIPTAMSRGRVPSARIIASFVRACGGDPGTVEVWLAAHKRIAGADRAVTDLASSVEVWLTTRRRAVTADRGNTHRQHATDANMTMPSRNYAAGSLAEVAQQSTQDRWIGVHRRSTRTRSRRLSSLARNLMLRSRIAPVKVRAAVVAEDVA